MDGNRLSGRIPNFNLPNLGALDLSRNQLSGEIPNFNPLQLLYALVLKNNQLSGVIPNFTLPKLRGLYLSNNQLSGSIPNFNLPRLETFDCYANQLTGLSNFTNLNLRPDTTGQSRGLRAYGNWLTFKDILLNLNLRTTATFIYAPQDSIFKDTKYLRNQNQPLTIDLGIDSAISDNQYKWFKNGVAYQTITGNNKLIFNSLQPSDSGTYTCQVTNPRAPLLILYSRKATIRVNQNCLTFNAPVAIAGDTAYCIGNSNPLTATAGFARYVWSTGDTTRTIASRGTQLYSVTVTNLVGCDTTITLQVKAYEPPIFNITGNLFLCEGKFTELNIAPVFSQYQWNTGVSNAKIKIMVGGNYTVTVTGVAGCTSQKAVTVIEQKVTRLPILYDSICKGDTYPFPSGRRTTQIGGIYQDTTRWETTFCDRTIRPIHLYVREVIEERDTLFVCDTLLEKVEKWSVVQGGCPKTKIRESLFDIEYCFDKLPRYNGLIVNGNQQNETFHIPYIERLQPNRLVIQDQRGMEVFQTNNYKNQWNGTDKKGNPLPTGEYDFVLEVMDLKKNKTYKREGTLYLSY